MIHVYNNLIDDLEELFSHYAILFGWKYLDLVMMWHIHTRILQIAW